MTVFCRLPSRADAALSAVSLHANSRSKAAPAEVDATVDTPTRLEVREEVEEASDDLAAKTKKRKM